MLADFAVENLGVESPDYFQGYGSGDYEFSTYGIGDTEAEALDDCLEMMAQTCGFDLTEADEKRIRDAYGGCDNSTTVAETLDIDEDYDNDDQPWFHVGIKWNERNE